ncbi:MAG: DUF4173 domain-containing protein [Pseudobutyrivibrio sp.]|nr:DUF4173 domain-containing protein [Pseudobutyrivibrio sp.]
MNNSIYFKKLTAPALVFALIYTLGWNDKYDSAGIGPLIAALTLIALIRYIMWAFERSVSKRALIYEFFIVALGASTVVIRDDEFVFGNHLVMAILMGALLIENFYDDSKWGFDMQFIAMAHIFEKSIQSVLTPFTDAKEGLNSGDKAKVKSAIVGVIIAVPLVSVIIWILMGADVIYENLVMDVLTFTDIDYWNMIRITFKSMYRFFIFYCIIRVMSDKNDVLPSQKEKPNKDALAGIIIMISISLVYITFIYVQIYAHIGKIFTLPQGYSYAEYAREGYFELLEACVINLLVVQMCKWIFKNNTLLKAIMVFVCAATYILLGDSFLRLNMYVGVYGYTPKRAAAYVGMTTIGIFLAGLIYSIYKEKFPLYKFGLFTFSTGYLVLTASHVEYWIYNIG